MDFQNSSQLEIQKIIDKKIFNGKTLYLVKWKNFPIEEATWECNKVLIHAKDKIIQYKNSNRISDQGSKVKIQDQISPSNPRDSFKRKRGRPPKMSLQIYKSQKKNLREHSSPDQNEGQKKEKRGRGRPRGSKNKRNKNIMQSEQSQISYESMKLIQDNQSWTDIERNIEQQKEKLIKKQIKIEKRKRKERYFKQSYEQESIVDSNDSLDKYKQNKKHSFKDNERIQQKRSYQYEQNQFAQQDTNEDVLIRRNYLIQNKQKQNCQKSDDSAILQKIQKQKNQNTRTKQIQKHMNSQSQVNNSTIKNLQEQNILNLNLILKNQQKINGLKQIQQRSRTKESKQISKINNNNQQQIKEWNVEGQNLQTKVQQKNAIQSNKYSKINNQQQVKNHKRITKIYDLQQIYVDLQDLKQLTNTNQITDSISINYIKIRSILNQLQHLILFSETQIDYKSKSNFTAQPLFFQHYLQLKFNQILHLSKSQFLKIISQTFKSYETADSIISYLLSIFNPHLLTHYIKFIQHREQIQQTLYLVQFNEGEQMKKMIPQQLHLYILIDALRSQNFQVFQQNIPCINNYLTCIQHQRNKKLKIISKNQNVAKLQKSMVKNVKIQNDQVDQKERIMSMISQYFQDGKRLEKLKNLADLKGKFKTVNKQENFKKSGKTIKNPTKNQIQAQQDEKEQNKETYQDAGVKSEEEQNEQSSDGQWSLQNQKKRKKKENREKQKKAKEREQKMKDQEEVRRVTESEKEDKSQQ